MDVIIMVGKVESESYLSEFKDLYSFTSAPCGKFQLNLRTKLPPTSVRKWTTVCFLPWERFSRS